jgi:hypothetical protein
VQSGFRQALAQSSPERLNGSQKAPRSDYPYRPADRVSLSPLAAQSVMAPNS